MSSPKKPESELTQTQRVALREQLVSEAETLRQALTGLDQQDQPVTLDQQAVGRVSRIDAIQQQQMAKANRLHLEQHLQNINAALTRWATEEFGECQLCGENIGYARLHIRPEARLCISCQDKKEHQ